MRDEPDGGASIVKDYSPKTPSADSSPTSRVAAGFRAHLQGVSLLDLVMLQHITRADGVYLVLSGERSGALHFTRGALFHAEITDGAASLVGNRAAVEILSWSDGEFLTSTQRPAERASVSLTMEELLGAPEGGLDLAQSATGVRRLSQRGAMASEGAVAPQTPDPRRVALAAVATPGTALTTRRHTGRADSRHEVEVLVSARGDLIDGRGPGAEGLAGRVAYVARLSELVGQAMGCGEVYGLRVRGPAGELSVRRQADGHIAGSFGPVDPAEAAPGTPVPPALPSAVPPPLPAMAPGPAPAGSSFPPGSISGGPLTRRSRTPSS
jgi:hypothetical protein